MLGLSPGLKALKICGLGLEGHGLGLGLSLNLAVRGPVLVTQGLGRSLGLEQETWGLLRDNCDF